jgi:hypothetical protein
VTCALTMRSAVRAAGRRPGGAFKGYGKRESSHVLPLPALRQSLCGHPIPFAGRSPGVSNTGKCVAR